MIFQHYFILNPKKVEKVRKDLDFFSVASQYQTQTLLKQLIYQRPVPFPVQFQEPVPVFFLLNRSLTYGQNGPNGATAKLHIAV